MTNRNQFLCLAIASLWLLLNGFSGATNANPLSAAEKSYLKDKKRLIFISQTRYPPFELVYPNGEHDGLSIELARWMAMELGFEARFTDNSLELAKEAVLIGDAHVLTSIVYSRKRDEQFEFSRPLFDVPVSIFVASNRLDIRVLNDLSGKKIAIPVGDYAEEFLAARALEFEAYPAENFCEAVGLLVDGAADAVIGDEHTIRYHIFKNKLSHRIKKVGEPLYVGQICMGARDSEKMLVGILNKGIDLAVEKGVAEKIRRKWLGTRLKAENSLIHEYLPYILAVVVFVGLVTLLVWYRNLRLQQQVAQRTSQLKQTQEDLGNLVENLHTGIYQSTAKGEGRFIKANSAMAKILGYAAVEELLEIPIASLYRNPADRDRLIREIRCRGQAKGKEFMLLKKDGTPIWVAVTATARKNPDGQIQWLDGVLEDITERKKAEEALHLQNEYMTALHETTLGLIKRLDVNDLLKAIVERACALVRTGHGYAYLYDAETDEITLRTGTGVYHEEIGERLKPGQGMAGRVWQQGKTLLIDDYSKWHGRDPREVFDNLHSAMGVPIKSGDNTSGVLGVNRFDTYHQFGDQEVVVMERFSELAAIALDNAELYSRLQHELKQHQQTETALHKYKYIVATSKDLMALIDADHVFQAVNDSFLNAIDKKRRDVIHSRVDDILKEDIFPEVIRKKLSRCLKGEEITHRTTFEYPGLGSRYMVYNLYPFFDEKNMVTGIVLNCRDITETKQLEEQLVHAQKMEAIGTLAGGIAHDFNNILMGILGNVSLLLQTMDADDPHRERLQMIDSYVQTAADLTRQLLGFARGGKYEVRPADMNAIIRKTSRMFGRTKKEISIHLDLEQELWTVEIDKSQIEQVMLNLYVNAWQAMPAGGQLHLQSENTSLTDFYVRGHDVPPGNYVKISITDTGVGMDEATRLRIFEPFFTTKKMGRGTGLGLASAYGIIKNHGGIINVYSEKGQGTTFNIYLPISDSDKIVEKEETPPADIKLEGKETILVVDDEGISLEAVTELLERIGYKIFTANGGQEALDIYSARKDEIDLVILDMIMPDMSGRETYGKLQRINPKVVVILASGYSLNGQARHILDLGCNGFIQKPFTMRQIFDKINEVLSTCS